MYAIQADCTNGPSETPLPMVRMTNGSESHVKASTVIKGILSPKTKSQLGF